MPGRNSEARKAFRARKAEAQFARQLRAVAKKCGKLAQKAYDPKAPIGSAAKLKRALENYATQLQPWAKAVAGRMLADVGRRDEAFWKSQSALISKELMKELKSGNKIGNVVRRQTLESASLITSLPLEAGQRIEKYAVAYMTKGIRARELSKRIMETGQVTESRANLIARTETSRAAGILQETRAKTAGSDGYIWRTSEDFDVRERHKKLNGKYFRWDAPPIAGENGERAHPGCIYNCRCWAEVVLPGEPKRGNRGRFRAEAA